METYNVVKLKGGGAAVSVESACVYSYHTHMHTYYEMTLYEPFDGTVAVNDRDFDMRTRSCILIAPSDFHRIRVDAARGARYIKIGFESDVPDRSYREGGSIVWQGIEQDDFLVSLFEEIQKQRQDERYVRHLVNAAIAALTRQGERVLRAESGTGYGLAVSAVRMLHESFDEGITQSSVARQLSVSPQYLSRVFRRTMQMSFCDYLCELRLKRATKLLVETDRSVTDICFDCGYGTLSHFLRSFKAAYGVSPGAYRRAHRI